MQVKLYFEIDFMLFFFIRDIMQNIHWKKEVLCQSYVENLLLHINRYQDTNNKLKSDSKCTCNEILVVYRYYIFSSLYRNLFTL